MIKIRLMYINMFHGSRAGFSKDVALAHPQLSITSAALAFASVPLFSSFASATRSSYHKDFHPGCSWIPWSMKNLILLSSEFPWWHFLTLFFVNPSITSATDWGSTFYSPSISYGGWCSIIKYPHWLFSSLCLVLWNWIVFLLLQPVRSSHSPVSSPEVLPLENHPNASKLPNWNVWQ